MGKTFCGTSTEKHPEPFPTSASDDKKHQTVTAWNYWSFSNTAFLKDCMQSVSHNYAKESEDPKMSLRGGGTWLVIATPLLRFSWVLFFNTP